MEQYNLLDVEAFLAVAQSGGFTSASKVLKTSKSVVSRRVRRLEDAMRTELIQRSTRSVELTEEGRIYFEALSNLPGQVRRAEGLLLSRRETPQGRLRVVLPSYLGSSHVTERFIPTFMAQHSEINLVIRFTDRGPLETLSDFDVAVMTKPKYRQRADSTLRIMNLGHVSSALYAAPRYLAQYGEPKTLADIGAHRCLSYPSTIWRFSNRNSEEYSTEVHPIISTGSNEVLKAATVSGLGIVYSFETVFRELVALGSVVEVLPELTATAGLELQMVFPAQEHPSLRSRLFMAGLKAEFAKME